MYELPKLSAVAEKLAERYRMAATTVENVRDLNKQHRIIDNSAWLAAQSENGACIGYEDALRDCFGADTLNFLQNTRIVSRELARFNAVFNEVKPSR